MLESFTLMLSVDCPACRTSLPINGIVPSVRCYHCGNEATLDAEFWTTQLGPDEWAEALACEPGEARTSTSFGFHQVRIAYGRRVPRCQKCKGPDLDPSVLVPMVERGQCFCPGCGTTIRVRPADELCRQVNPRARFVVHETAQDAAALAMQAKTTPVLFSCMGCNGGLSVDGSQRQVACTYCGASNYLPDGLWQQLRPVPTPEVFFLICEYDAAARIEARWVDDDARREDAARTDLTFEQYQRLAADEDSDVRAAVAENPAVPPQVLDVLAQDDSYRVRAAVVANPTADPSTLHRLVTDSDSDVRTALAARPGLPPQLLDALARDDYYGVRRAVANNPATDPSTLHRLVTDSDSDVLEALAANPRLAPASVEELAKSDDYQGRVAAAKHPALSLDTLRRLARDDDSDVQEAARGRLAELQSQGVDVNQGRGLFGKLFG